VSTTKIDLEPTIPGAETAVAAFPDCPTGSAVELWTIEGGSHIPTVTRAFMSRVIDFLYAHPKP
jgi:polyhydroxybutyrate depolymerase